MNTDWDNSDLLSTYVGKVKYYKDKHTHSYSHGELLLEGYRYTILDLIDNKTYETILEPEYTYKVSVVEHNTEYTHLTISKNDGSLIGSFMVNFYRSRVNGKAVLIEDQIPIIEEHINALNRKFSNLVAIFETSVVNGIETLKADVDSYQIISNFLNICDYKYFLDIDYFRAFEKKIRIETKFGTNLIHSESHNVSYGDAFYEAESFFENEFSMLIRIVSANINVSFEECIFITWTILKELSVVYFSNILIQDYGDYFINCNSIGECVNVYVQIDTINPDSMANASLLSYYCIDKFPKTNLNFLEMYHRVCSEISLAKDQVKLNNFRSLLLNTHTMKSSIAIDDIDLMNGHEFEHFISSLFAKMGYSTYVTKGSGDQGVDVVAEKNMIKIGIQAKCYSNSITNKAVQEIVAGIKHYNLSKGIVVTNNYFTESAQELANSNGIVLWDRTILKEKIENYFK